METNKVLALNHKIEELDEIYTRLVLSSCALSEFQHALPWKYGHEIAEIKDKTQKLIHAVVDERHQFAEERDQLLGVKIESPF